MATDLTRSMFGFDPICVHPWNPWLIQAFHSISTCHPPPILEELSFHDVIMVKSRHPLETWKNPENGLKSLQANELLKALSTLDCGSATHAPSLNIWHLRC